MKVSVLSTGTELTNGQTLNRNSAWISAELKKQGIDASLHITLPDNEQKILQAIDFCAAQSDVIFVTGGLGPTTDDFTRKVISTWTELPLEFSQSTWERIQQYLQNRGVTPRENQKQQCYFPQGSNILSNAAGTADGFICEKFHQIENQKRKITFIVLPGPPREIETLWKDHLDLWLKQKTKHIDFSVTQSWDTLGLPESEVDEIVWAALTELKKDFPMEVGFREHLPYIEVKLTYPKSVEFTAQVYVEKVNKALSHVTVLKNFEKADQLFIEIIKDQSFAFYDFATGGALHQSLSSSLKKSKDWMWKQSKEPMDSDFFSDEENFLALIPIDEISCQLIADLKGKKISKKLEAPTRFKVNSERKMKYYAELALIEFVRRF